MAQGTAVHIASRSEARKVISGRAINCAIAGSRVRIEGLPPSLRKHVEHLLQPFIVEEGERGPLARLRVERRGRGMWALYLDDGEVSAGCGGIVCILPTIEWRAITLALDATNEVAVVHAAALTRGGRTALLIAPSGRGKTTLTLGLMGRGWEPFADDLSLIDTTALRLQPFPRCFHVDASSLELLPTHPELDWSAVLKSYARPFRWAKEPQRPTTIIVVDRGFEGKATSALSPLTQAEAAAAILGATVRNQLSGSELARVSVRLAAQARSCHRLNNGVLADALDLIEAACTT